MMAGNPNWWSMSNMLLPQYAAPSSSLPCNSLADNQEFPHSWSQLLLGGLVSEQEEDKISLVHFQSKKLENNWEEQILNPSLIRVPVGDVKPEVPQSSHLYNHGDDHDHEFQQTCRPSWSQVMPVSSPRSCVTSSLSSNILDFSNNKGDGRKNQQYQNHSSGQCYSTTAGGVSKKPRVQSSSTPPLKVRKEKLGDRITALHQIVSPFGKTDTASVLLEAIGYIGFLQRQIEALSSPYLANIASANTRHQHSVQGERTNCTYPEEYDQLSTDNYLKRRGASKQGNEDAPKDLRSSGLCLVPVSCMHHIGSDNIGADYWAPTLGGEF